MLLITKHSVEFPLIIRRKGLTYYFLTGENLTEKILTEEWVTDKF